MNWFRSHPYAISILGAGILLVLGTLLVLQKSSVSGESGASTWSANNQPLNFVDQTGSSGGTAGENLYTDVRSGPPFYYNPNPTPIPVTKNGLEETFYFEAFLSLLSRPAKTSPSSGGETFDVYSFIPSGLISTTTSRSRTEVQQALYNYGNEVGSSIETYESAHRNSPQVLKDQFEDRRNPTKNAALLELASGMSRLADTMLALEEIPPQVQSTHEHLAEGYQEMGKRLSRIPEAKTDEEVLQSMLSYNASVEAFTKSYVALATLFSVYGVSFDSGDPGSVFVFTDGSF